MSKKEIFLRNLKAADLRKEKVAKFAINKDKKRIKKQIRNKGLCRNWCNVYIGFGILIAAMYCEATYVLPLVSVVIGLGLALWVTYRSHKTDKAIQEFNRTYKDGEK